MKKLIFLMVSVIILAIPSEAQLVRSRTFAEKEKTGYDRISVGYDAMFLDHNFSTLNGANLQYIHGFKVAKFPLFLEIGVDVSYNTKTYLNNEYYYSNDELNFWHDYYVGNDNENRLNSLSVRIPINVSYRFNLSDKFSIQPYTGINFKINPLFEYNYSKYIYLSYYDPLYQSYYEYSHNKLFQMGWQIGLGFNYSKLYLGVQYCLDFMPRANLEIMQVTNILDYLPLDGNYYNYYNYDLKSSRLLVSLGIQF